MIASHARVFGGISHAEKMKMLARASSVYCNRQRVGRMTSSQLDALFWKAFGAHPCDKVEMPIDRAYESLTETMMAEYQVRLPPHPPPPLRPFRLPPPAPSFSPVSPPRWPNRRFLSDFALLG